MMMSDSIRNPKDSRVISDSELLQHRSVDDAWVSMDGRVFDVSDFMASHPGGPEVFEGMLGKDISKAFKDTHKHR